ncbi:MAG: ribose transport system permease protein [Frankiaceae bacterium]|jgi:ribose transport system permease protein|nr:ribose transport system permease protein [Frankiaceae bacterium]
MRNSALLVVLLVICVIGTVSAGGFGSNARFATNSNILTILRLAATTGVIAVGMTFVIIGGGIDLSVGAIVALASVWATTVATQEFGPLGIVFTALAVGTVVGAVNGVLIAYGRIAPFIATLAMLASARGLAEEMSGRRTQVVKDTGFNTFFTAEPGGIPMLVIMFAVVAVLGWIVLNRTTFGRRTFAIGGNAEAARLAGINVRRHTLFLYALLGFCCGIGAVMIMARTTTGSSTHGLLYELDAIAAVVIGGTILAGGRGTMVGTVIGVLIFATVNNIFALNNYSTSRQAIARGVIIVIAVLFQQRLARSTRST